MSSNVTALVKDFYEHLPFNYFSTADAAAQCVTGNPLLGYGDLGDLLSSGAVANALDVGCGTGLMALAAAYHYGVAITGVDLAEQPIERARAVAEALNVADRGKFVQSDLFEYDTEQRFDLVYSIGALHHSRDARAAFFHIQKFVADRGSIFIGLYHDYSRRVMLEMFHEIVASQGEQAAFEKFRSMKFSGDVTHEWSWFRDQVLHPHETLHTLEEVVGWLDECNFNLISTSINKYEDWDDIEELIRKERELEQVSIQRNRVENRFFPGFFTVLAEKSPG